MGTRVWAALRGVDRFALAIILAGVVLRAVWLLDARVAPLDDTAYYYQHASELAAGEGYRHPETGEPSAFLPPGYPLLLAAVFVFTGPSTVAGGMLNVALAAAGLAFTYGLARRFFSANPARLATAILAFFPSQVVYTPALIPDILFTTLVMAALWSGIGGKPGRGRLALTGVFLGAAVLTAPKAILLLPALAVAWHEEVPWRDSVLRAAVAGACMLAVVTPWSIRSSLQLDAPVFVATNGGPNLWIGNNPEANGGWMPFQEGSNGWVAPRDEASVNRDLTREAISYALRNPVATVGLWPEKLDEAFSQDFNYLGHFSLVTRDQPLPAAVDNGVLERLVHRYYFTVIVLALLGSVAIVARRHPAGILGWPAMAVVAPILIFFGLDRFHVPLLPLLAIVGPGGCALLAESARRALSSAPAPGVSTNEEAATEAPSEPRR